MNMGAYSSKKKKLNTSILFFLTKLGLYIIKIRKNSINYTRRDESGPYFLVLIISSYSN